MLWQDLEWAVHAQKPSSVSELKQFCKVEPCERQKSSNRRQLVAVVAAKGGTTNQGELLFHMDDTSVAYCFPSKMK